MGAKFLSINSFKRWRWVILIFSIFIVAVAIYFPNYAKLKKLRQENKRLTLENKKFEKEIADYQGKLRRLGKDAYIYERIARDDLGIAKENEIVIDIEQ